MTRSRDYQFPQTITRWRQSGEPDIYGRRSWEREVLKARYQQVNRMFVREDGENQRSLAWIYTKEDVLEIADHVALGEFTEEEPVATAADIKQKRVLTNMRGNRQENRYIQ